jgi:tetratricopeptide (TPR) repeat protein
MNLRATTVVVWIWAIVSCSPKVTDVKTESPVVISDPIKQEPKGPCKSFTDLTGYDKERAETAFVLYKDALKAGKYAEAITHWKLAYQLAPGSNGRVKYHFEDGAAIYRHFFENTKDESLRRTYVDTIMMIYDKKKECFGDEAYINGIKGFEYYYYFGDYTTPDNIFELLKSNFDVKGIQADYFVVNPFSKVLYDRVLTNKISKEEGRKYANLIFKTTENGLATCKGKSCDAWTIIKNYAPVLLESLEGVDDFYDCDYYAGKYYKLFKENPDSCDVVNLAYARLLRGNCPVSDSRLAEIKSVKGKKCYVAPPALSCAAQGNEDYSQGKYNKAIESYQTCIAQSNDADQKARYLLLIAKIYYRDLRNYPKARQFALDAAKMKSGWGEPYLLIGNLYASSGPLCGPGTGWDSQVVVWPAIDMWTKAKNTDPKSASEANALINRYSQFMPSKEDIFFRTINKGDNYFVRCWIQENTLVRTSD